MKIVYIITDLCIGGAQIMLYNLLLRMNRERFAPVVISLMERGPLGDRIAEMGIPVYAIDLKPENLAPTAIWQLIRLVRQLQPDLIQGWMHHGNLAAQVCSIFSLKTIPVLWNIQNSMYSLEYEKKMTAAVVRLSAYLSKLASNIIYVSRVSQSQYEALGYCSRDRCVIPNGIDTSRFMPAGEHRLSLRAELGLPEDSILIGLMARFHPQKDHNNFLQAAALLWRNYPNVHFVLSGYEVDRENQTLTQQIQELGLVNQVCLLGERKDMHRLNAALDIGSLPSAYGEAFSLALGEAMSCGVPCVVTDIGDSAWMVDTTGRIVPPRNSEALANAWKELIDLGTEGRTALGQAARARAIAHFSLDSVVDQYETLYERVFSQTVNKKI